MADAAIIREWLNKAEEDLRFAEANLLEGNEFFAQICFHFQQAAEKYLTDKGRSSERLGLSPKPLFNLPLSV